MTCSARTAVDVGAPGLPRLARSTTASPVDNPYHADLPYVDKQKALFGEASYKFGQFKLTAGGRWYDFQENARIRIRAAYSRTTTTGSATRPSRTASARAASSAGSRTAASASTSRSPRASVSAASTTRSIFRCAAPRTADLRTFGGFQTYKDETLWNYEAGFKYSKHGDHLQRRRFLQPDQEPAGHADAGSCSSRIVFNVPKAHSEGIEAEFAVHPLPGLDLRSPEAAEFEVRFDGRQPGPGGDRTGIRKGNRLPTVPKYQFAATANYERRFNSNADWYVNGSVQRDREPIHAAERPGAGAGIDRPASSSIRRRAPPAPVRTDIGSFKLPAYTLVNASAGLKFDSGLELVAYVKNIFDTDPKLSLDRERGVRARIGYNVGQPRHDRTDGATELRRTPRRRRRRRRLRLPPPPPTQTVRMDR